MKMSLKVLRQKIQEKGHHRTIANIQGNPVLTKAKYVSVPVVLALLDEHEAELRLFIAIHENEGHKISPKLLRKEVFAE